MLISSTFWSLFLPFFPVSDCAVKSIKSKYQSVGSYSESVPEPVVLES